MKILKNKLTKKVLRNTLGILLISTLLGCLFQFWWVELGVKWLTNNNFTLLYTLIGILFSVGISLAVSFTYNDIKNESYYISLDFDIKTITYSFVSIFFLSTFIFIMNPLTPNLSPSDLNIIQSLTLKSSNILLLLTILWMTLMFLNIYKLKSDLDKTRREELKK